MRINKIDDGYAVIALDSAELVDICNAFYKNKPLKDRTKMLYSNLMMARDLSQYGHIDAFCFESIMKQRGYDHKDDK